MTHLFIIEFENSDIYYITYSKHITKLHNMLDKYNIFTIKDYHKFNICNNFREHQIHENILFIQKAEFVDYFNYFYKKYQLKNNFYQFDKSTFNNIIDYLNNFKSDIIYNNINKPKELFNCPKCNKYLSSITYVNKHMENGKGLTCNICNNNFSSVQTYNNHIKNCGVFKCEFCKSTFNSQFKFNKHTLICLKHIKNNNKNKKKKVKKEIPKDLEKDLPKEICQDIIINIIDNII